MVAHGKITKYSLYRFRIGVRTDFQELVKVGEHRGFHKMTVQMRFWSSVLKRRDKYACVMCRHFQLQHNDRHLRMTAELEYSRFSDRAATQESLQAWCNTESRWGLHRIAPSLGQPWMAS